MSCDVIDLEAERGRRDMPDPEHVSTDAEGWPLYRYTADYQCDGGHYDLEFWAYDLADAERQVEAMRTSLTLVGQVMARIEE